MKKLLFLLCCLEVLFATFLINTLGPYVSSVVLFSISIGIAFLFLKISQQPDTGSSQNTTVAPSPVVVKALQWVLFGIMSYLVFARLKHIWWYELTYPEVSIGSSDVIPQITALVQRFLHGEQPYYPIKFSQYDLFPTYLPFQWLPYIPLEMAHKDYRWVPTFAMWLASFYYFVRHRKTGAGAAWDVLLPVWPLIVWFAFVMHAREMFVFAVEGLIAAYYFFVAESIKLKNTILLAIAMSVCLLSRYSIVFWAPLCVALHLIAGKKKDALIICATALIMFVGIYWLPFLSKDYSIFIEGYRYHTSAAYAEWMHDLARNDGAAYLYNGLGFTPFALKLLPGDENYVLLTYKNIHLAMCILCVAALGFVYLRNRDKYTLHNFLLFSFKIYLTVFYVFIQIPYKYLFFVPIFISVSLLGKAFVPGAVKEKQTFTA
jgi:hypothetical protein